MLQQELLHVLKRGVFVCDKTIRPPTSQFQNAKRTLEEKQTTRIECMRTNRNQVWLSALAFVFENWGCVE